MKYKFSEHQVIERYGVQMYSILNELGEVVAYSQKIFEMKSAAIKPETANRITANILRIINYQPGCVAYRINNVGVFDAAKGVHRAGNTEKGLPDIWACIKGRFVVIEVKAGKDRLSEHQMKRKFEIEKSGGLFIVARSTDQFINEFNLIVK